jgi:CHAD domain-containing protein
MIEREVKLVAPATFELPDLTVAAAGRPVAVLPEQRLAATYYDTADLRLIRWGVTLRHRVGDDDGAVWTVKAPASGTSGVVARNEVEFAGPADVIPPEALALLRGFVRSAALGPVARLETRRQRVRVRDGEGRTLLEVDDDTVSVRRGSGEVACFREVEVELGTDVDPDDGLLADVVARLARAGAVPGEANPKLVQALGPEATAAPEVVPVVLDRHSSAGDVVQAAIATAVTRLLHHDVAARLGDHPEDVHQARAATRRLRSDLRTFRAFVDEGWAKGVREELRWLAGCLGAVRDVDVLLERLRAHADALPEPDRVPAARLLRGLVADRDAARTNLLAALASDRYADLVGDLVLAAGAPPLTPEARAPGRAALPDVVRRPWKHLAGAARSLGKHPADEKLHEVRIRAKRARYASEAVAPVVGKPARRLAAALADVQSALGDLQDGAVAEGWLRSAIQGTEPAEAVAAGQLIAVQHQEMAAARRHWRTAWKAASEKSLRTWLA